jgi:hypothetical protein
LKDFLRNKTLWIIALLVMIVAVFTFSTRRDTIDFSTQVKPIFNKKCITCHGGVKQKGGFSLLFREEAMANTESGKPAIVPGEPDKSELIRRLTLKDPEERMPFKHEPLSKEEIGVLRDWVKQGAQWGKHWAYTALQPVTVPKSSSFFGLIGSSNDGWVKNDIDYFVLEKLKENKLSHSSEANKTTLLRRVGLDLIGMPVPQSLASQYLANTDERAYETLVDSLLASPHYGERWASLWLDLARYADTKGYERDDSRNIWRYRDWLINAFNADKPYDSFLTEQLAGDLLPHATDNQILATAFHRNTMTNDEGGTNNEEFRTAAVMDRVNSTWEGLMGTTFACVQCHSHPYDPFKHDDYYKFLAFFNNSRDEDTYADYPLLRHFSDSALQEKDKLITWVQKNGTDQDAMNINQFVKTWEPAFNSLTCDQFINSELADTKWLALRNKAICRLPGVNLDNRQVLTYRYQAYLPGGNWQIHLDKPDGMVISRVPLAVTKNGWAIASLPLQPATGMHDLFFTYNNPNLKKPDDNGAMFDWFYFSAVFPGAGKPGYEENKKRYWWLVNLQTPTTPVMTENPFTMQRATHIFERGNWLVKGDTVSPGIPASLNPMPANAPKNRLGLAMWMTSKQNPLTARTMVNRLWEQLFGVGLVETLEDLGSQGAGSSHQQLLDYLSYKFMNDYNWSIKKLLKEIVMSATYQQDSKVSKELLEKDASNKWYARGPRVRLTAEQVRDQALVITGLLSEKMYGPGVMPYQPENIWQSPYSGANWEESWGENKYRRAVYTYWKRTAPYPSMITFDAVAREVCTARRIRTNTPLQALVTLNDEAYLDMARKMVYRMEDNFPDNKDLQIRTLYERATGHSIDNNSFNSLTNLYKKAFEKFNTDPAKSCEMAGSISKNQSTASTAAMVMVANAVLNLDEVVTKN